MDKFEEIREWAVERILNKYSFSDLPPVDVGTVIEEAKKLEGYIVG